MKKEKEFDKIKLTKRLLAELEQNRQACVSLRTMLECMDGLKGIEYNGVPSRGKIEDPTLELVAKKMELELRLKNTERIVNLIDNALELLSEDEKRIVKQKYVIGLPWSKVAADNYYSRAWAFRLGNRALQKVANALFGEE